MKKLLLSTAAIAGLAMIATPAAAQVKLELGGYFKGYGAYVDQDENADTNSAVAGVQGAGNVNDLDFIRDTEIHFGGETTLDNGLSVGAHIEADVDGTTSTGNDSFQVDESYVYFSGGWGRVNFGDEDGASYLLQVAAPSADSNIDGIRQYVQPVNYTAMLGDANDATAALNNLANTSGGLSVGGLVGNSVDYDQDPTGKSTKLTYLSPIMNGFQAGLSYVPDAGGADDLEGIGFDDVNDAFGAAYEAALRYEGQFNNVGVILGAGYSHVELEGSDFTAAGAVPTGLTAAALGDATDDRTVWNVGADFDIGAFGLGVIYREDDAGEIVNVGQTATAAANTGDEEETFVVGADYTTGPFKLGASYLTQDNTYGVENLDTERYSGGVTYTYGPGMTFRGSIGYVEHELTDIGGPGSNDIDATYVTLGTQINF